MDNLGSHKAIAVRRTIVSAGVHRLFQPPDSPDLNPIEQVMSKLKYIIRKAREQTSWLEINGSERKERKQRNGVRSHNRRELDPPTSPPNLKSGLGAQLIPASWNIVRLKDWERSIKGESLSVKSGIDSS